METLPARPVIYEVSLSVDPEIIGEYDAWLRRHVDEMLALPGFLDAEILRPESRDGARVERLVLYRLRDREALDEYLEKHAPRMREDGLRRFGERFSARRRIIEAEPESGARLPAPGACPNCGSSLITHYCAHCGQENRDYHIAFHRLVLDFLGDNFTFDSRLFRSLKPLLLRPGQLTRDYMDGRRARHIPPLRMYLFISILFFALLASGSLADAGLEREAGAAAPENVVTADDSGGAVRLNGEELTGISEEWDPWLQRVARNARLYGENQALFVQKFLNRLPVAMFVMLPIYALLLKLLYLFSRRYYMEHLIFAFHVHAFTFLVFIGLEIWSSWLAPALGVTMHWSVVTAITLWIMLYPWFAMRRTYGQGWWMTTLKYLSLGFIYTLVILPTGLASTAVATLL